MKYILDNHDEKGQLNPKRLGLVSRTGDESSGDIGAHNLKNRGLDILISEPLDVPILDFIKRDVLFLSHICRGLLPMLYRIDKNPDW